MKKALFLFMALIVPFFSQATSIYDNVDKQSPKTVTEVFYDCLVSTSTGNQTTYNVKLSACQSLAEAGYQTLVDEMDVIDSSKTDFILSVSSSGVYYIADVEWTYTRYYEDGTVRSTAQRTQQISGSYYLNEHDEQSKSCPPDGFPNHIMFLDENGDGEIDTCINPSDLSFNDSCNINDSPPLQVTEQSACYTKSDGSQCSVTAVNVGGGNQVYMGDEGDCYSDPRPDVTGNPSQIEANVDGSCTNNGGLLACVEDPDNVCNSSGSDYGGGSVNNCQSGCGYVNDSFTCYDTDIDGDGVPDYNDPDVDGDGIPNDSDLDNDGDGVDDSIYGQDANGNGGTSSGTQIDLTPVVTELKKLNEFFKETAIPQDTIQSDLDTLNTDYTTDLGDFIAKGSSELGYTDVLILGNSGGLSVVPSNSCSAFTVFNQPFNICPAADRVKPILYWLFGMLTAWHIFFLVNKTIKDNS